MLQNIRHLAQSWVFKGLMMFLILSFGIWGIGDIFRGNPLQRTVAKAGKVSISVQALNHDFEQMLGRARQSLGADLTNQQARQIGLLDQALNVMIQHATIDQDVKRLGLDVSDKTIIDRLASQPQFRGKDGKFDKDQFRQLLGQINMSERGFIDIARQELARQQLNDALTSGGKIPQTIVDNVYRARAQKRVFDVVTLKNAGIGGLPAPDDGMLRDFYQRNATQFTAPEYRALTIAVLSIDEVTKDISVTDDDVKKEYESRAAELAQPERRDIVQVVLQDEGKAAKLAAAARAGNDLAAAAGSAKYDAVPLDKVDEKTMLPELAEPVFALTVGRISDPVKSSLGWHVVQVKKIYPPGKPEFKNVKEQLREDLQRDQAIETATRMVNQFDDSLAAGHALEDIADSLKLRLIKIPAVDADGKTPDGKAPSELPDRADVLKSAFGQTADETSPVMDDRKGSYVVVRTDRVTPSAAIPFDQVKDKVAAGWRAEEQAKRAQIEAESIAKAMREGRPAASFAAQGGVEVRTSKPVSLLDDTDSEFPQPMLPRILKMKKGEVIASALPDRQIIVRLAQVTDVDPAAGGGARGKVASDLGSRMPNELAEQYIKYLRVLFPVTIDQNLMDTLRQEDN